VFQLNDSQESVPQDAESGLMSSTPAGEDTEPLAPGEEEGAVGGVKIVLYQRPSHYGCEPGTSVRYTGSSQFSSDSGSLSSPVAQCHMECTSEAVVERGGDFSDSDPHSLCDPLGVLHRAGSEDSLNCVMSDEDIEGQERHALIAGVAPDVRTVTLSAGSSGESVAL